MTVTRPFGAALRRYRNDLETLWSLADSWVGIWAERLDPHPPLPSFDNVVPLTDGQLYRAKNPRRTVFTRPSALHTTRTSPSSHEHRPALESQPEPHL